jgi:MFS family permease
MYSITGWLNLVSARRLRAESTARVSGNVIFLGLTSLFTDISSEMVVSVLPAYLVMFLRLTPAQFGVIDGLYQGVAALVQLASGILTDRWRRYKEVAAFGYGVSAVSRVGLLLTAAWTGIAATLMLDRLGKGARTAPRDALISLSTPREHLGIAFGVHRAMDAMGAMLGPLVAFAVLAQIHDAFDVVFAASLAFSVIGLACLLLFVENRTPAGEAAASERWTLRDSIALLRMPEYRHLALCAVLLSLATVSDAFVFLALQRRAEFGAGAFPLLYLLTALGFLAMAIPLGRLADRVGRFKVFIGGFAVLVIAYALMLTAGSGWMLIASVLVLLGVHYAATDGVLMALGSALLPDTARASGLALLSTATALARFAASVLFGIVWTQWSLDAALVGFAVALVAALTIAIRTRPAALVHGA